MQLFDRICLRRVLKFAFLLQVIFVFSFAMLQMPHFLGVIKGIKFSFGGVCLMVALRTLEWINSIIMLSIMIAMLTIIGLDFSKNNASILMMQMGQSRTCWFRPIMIISLSYAGVFALMDGVCIPKANLYLKQMLVEVAKDKLISLVQPRNIVPYRDWNFTTLSRLSEEDLFGVLVNKEKDPGITLLVRRMHFDNKKKLHLRLEDGVGKVTHNNYTIKLRFKHGKFVGPPSLVTANMTNKNYTIFALRDVALIMRRLGMALCALLLPFFVFIMLFEARKIWVLGSAAFVLMLLYSADVIMPFNVYAFIVCMGVVYWVYRKLVHTFEYRSLNETVEERDVDDNTFEKDSKRIE